MAEDWASKLEAAANAAPGYAGTAPSADTPMVWLGGWETSSRDLPNNLQRQVPGGVPGSIDVRNRPTVAADQAVAEFYGWDDKKLVAWKSLLEANGIESTSYEDLQTKWASAVQMAAQSWAYYQNGWIDKPLTPEQAIKKLGEKNAALFGGDSGAPQTTVSSDTTNLSASDVRALGESAWQSELGRNPTAGEMSGIQSSTTGTTTRTTQMNGDSSSVTQNGANLGQLAVENARSQQDYAEFQASTTYFNALVDAIGRVA